MERVAHSIAIGENPSRVAYVVGVADIPDEFVEECRQSDGMRARARTIVCVVAVGINDVRHVFLVQTLSVPTRREYNLCAKPLRAGGLGKRTCLGASVGVV